MAIFTRPKQHQGQDLRLIPGADTATLIENWRYDPDTRGWVADRGWEPMIDFDLDTSLTSNWAVFSRLRQDYDSLFAWQNKGSTETYYFYEQGGILYSLHRSVATIVPDFFRYDTQRQAPTPDYAGTQYVPYGKFLLVMNGKNTPLKIYGQQHHDGDALGRDTLKFGFTTETAPPSIIAPSVTNVYGATATANGRVGFTPNLMDIRNAGQGEWSGATSDRNPRGSTYYGLGSVTSAAMNTYSYRVSFISDTGSESPLSAPVSVSWIQATSTDLQVVQRMGVILKTVPKGPPGTVARRIYRTRRKVSQEVDGDLYWLVAQISDNCTDFFIDTVPDAQLVTAAPLPTDSVVISQGYRYGAAWQGRMWLAGGADTGTRVIYSLENRPEQFRAFDFFDVGTRDGGAITGLFPFYDNLLVFRERAIDLITRTPTGFSINQLSANIGTRATNTIKAVPGIGVMFLTETGVYLFSGGTVGGSTVTVTEVSQAVRREFELMNTAALPKATAVYNPVDQEYWVHFPTQGSSDNNRGVVFHVANQQWSVRGDSQSELDYASDLTPLNRWRIQHMAWDGRNVILACKPFPSPDAALDADTIASNLGLQVWSASNSNGFIYEGYGIPAPEEPAQWLDVDTKDKLPSTYISGWHRLTDGAKVQFLSIELEVLSLGNLQDTNQISVEFAVDYDYEWTPAKDQPHTHSESYSTNSKERVWAPAAPTPHGFLKEAILGESRVSQERLVRVRYDIHTASVQSMRFKLTTREPVHLVAYRIKFQDTSINTVEVIP